MLKLEDVTKNASVSGILPNAAVTIVDVKFHGSDVLEAFYKGPDGQTGSELLFRDRESTLELLKATRPWSFTGNGDLFRLASEAYRIHLAYLFDPVLAVHTSLVDPYPHQITAVYEEMLTRQPLRFLLADDPGSGKTIMAGLLIKELIARGDVKRCMIISPGNLVEQWQEELWQKFQLDFEIMTNDKYESSVTGNWFNENRLCICRLDKLSRNELIQEKLKTTDWDLIVVDEAHKMSASYYGGEKKETKRYKLGKLLSSITRHFLLMTATPHNGKEEDFQLFMALIDGDRFEGKFKEGTHVANVNDVMRRMVKETLYTFEEKRLFPERRAYAVQYKLSEYEEALYKEVTDYVKEEFNRAESLNNDGRKGTVGFALMILQRRLASSPEAIYQSLRRRKERLEKRLTEEKLLERGGSVKIDFNSTLPALDNDELIDDFEDAPVDELEQQEEEILDRATAAKTIEELQIEVKSVSKLEELALKVKRSGKDKKWEQLSSLLQDNEHMFDANGHRRKLVIFTEHKDTLNYLRERICTLLGEHEAVVIISGGMLREERKKSEKKFTQDKDTLVLIATDAAGEGINLQRAHLMVNYDLPWNPNRLEQRFGRIHRIGQTEVCHLWNLIAHETREGAVFQRLLEKLEIERKSLNGAVFDVLGRAIEGRELRELLVEAIRYGESPEVRSKLLERVDNALDHEKLKTLIEDKALTNETMDTSRIREIRDDMERADARRLQPFFISSFFIEAFRHLGGRIIERESKRFEITRVPAVVRNRDRIIGTREALLDKIERVTFEKALINVQGKPVAEFICPGHPLLDATIDLILENNRDLLKQGAILIDDNDLSENIHALFYLENSIQDANVNLDGSRKIISKQFQFVSIDESANVKMAGHAPYLDYRAASNAETSLIENDLNEEWLGQDLSTKANSFAITEIVPRHLEEVKSRKEKQTDKIMEEVKSRLTKEINHWDYRAQCLKESEERGKKTRISSSRAQARANDLASRLEKRLKDLENEKKLSPLSPVIVGGALVVSAGYLAKLQGDDPTHNRLFARDTKEVEMLAMDAVMQAERELGNTPRDVSADNCGYDIESRNESTGKLRFIEVKGRVYDATTVTVSRNEVITGINTSENFILAIVLIKDGSAKTPIYVRNPFEKEPDFDCTSSNYNLKKLIDRGTPPT